MRTRDLAHQVCNIFTKRLRPPEFSSKNNTVTRRQCRGQIRSLITLYKFVKQTIVITEI